MGSDTILLFQLAVEICLAEQAVTLHLQPAEIILHHWHIQPLRWGKVAVFDHVAQRQLVNAVAEQRIFIAAHHAVVMEAINPAFAEAERRGGEPQQADLRIHALQVS